MEYCGGGERERVCVCAVIRSTRDARSPGVTSPAMRMDCEYLGKDELMAIYTWQPLRSDLVGYNWLTLKRENLHSTSSPIISTDLFYPTVHLQIKVQRRGFAPNTWLRLTWLVIGALKLPEQFLINTTSIYNSKMFLFVACRLLGILLNACKCKQLNKCVRLISLKILFQRNFKTEQHNEP